MQQHAELHENGFDCPMCNSPFAVWSLSKLTFTTYTNCSLVTGFYEGGPVVGGYGKKPILGKDYINKRKEACYGMTITYRHQ